MWGVLVSVLGWLFDYVLGAGAIKWVLLAVLSYGVTFLFDAILSLLPSWFSPAVLAEAFNFMPPGAWFFWDYAQGSIAVAMIMGAAVTRFIIRRIPFIG